MATGLAKIRALAEFLVVAVCMVTFLFTALGIITTLFAKDAAGSHDFVEYWASGHQLWQRANPYDAVAILNAERSVGFPPKIPALIMGNPPSALLITLPLGAVDADTGDFAWLVVLVVCLAVSVWMLRAMHGSPTTLLHLLGLAYAPALSCLFAGQVTILMLLGLVLFLRFQQSHPFWAGASLWFCLLKPHLFLPFGAVLLLWIIFTRKYSVLLGVLSALAASSAVATILDRQVWSQYSEMMRQTRIDRSLMPSLGSMMRQYIPPHTLWVQCIPAALGCLWAVWYFMKFRRAWNWLEHGSLLILISVLVAPYSWFMDQTILIAAVLHGAYTTQSRLLISVLALMSAAVEIGILLKVPLLHSQLYAWTAPAWLIWYLVATHSRHQIQLSAQPA